MKTEIREELKRVRTETKPAKRVAKTIEYIKELQEYVDYYTGHQREFNAQLSAKLEYVFETLIELGADQREHDARLAKKLKAIWKSKGEIDENS